MKKILFFIPTLAQGGGERIVSDYSLYLPDTIERTIVLLENKVSYPYKGKLLSLNIPTPKNFLAKAYYAVKGFFLFRRVVRQEWPSHVMSFGIMPNFLNSLLNYHAVVRIGNSLSKGSNGIRLSLLKLIVPFVYSRARGIIVASYGLKEDLVKNFGISASKISVIHNPINIKSVQKLAKESLPEEYQDIFKNPVIMNIGRLNEQKGQWHLIHAFKKIQEREGRITLLIMGEGPMKQTLKTLIVKEGLENYVHLVGWQKNPFAFLARSKIFVLPSLWEGFGSVLLEAMACKVPIISSDCDSGPRDILSPASDIHHKTTVIEYAPYGILVPPGEETLLSQAINTLFINEALQKEYKEKSLKRAMMFDVKKIFKEYQDLLETYKNF